MVILSVLNYLIKYIARQSKRISNKIAKKNKKPKNKNHTHSKAPKKKKKKNSL